MYTKDNQLVQSILEIMMATNDFINIRNVTLSFTNVSSASSLFRRNGRERSLSYRTDVTIILTVI